MASQLNTTEDLKVFITVRESKCNECLENLGRSAWITLVEGKGELCLSCADLDHLIYLPSGDPALTRRAKKYSTLSAVVLKWSRARGRYERQGLIVEEEALEKAEKECLADNDVRERRRERDAVRREEMDQQYLRDFAGRVRELYPGCPTSRETVIAEHACRKYSGRVGRSASAKSLDKSAVRLAVIAHIRHRETDYDHLLAIGYGRHKARFAVEKAVEQVLRKWETPKSTMSKN